ncbi:MAG: 1-acyl-sn-glycerol-3-phosphate acyltransferase [Cyclobacteriaceae bacterium]
MGRWLARLFLKIMGWKIATSFPEGVNKGVIVAAPHTSNWDFVFARLALYLLNVPVKYTIKKEWIEIPVIGWFLQKAGAIAIDRSKQNSGKRASMTDQMTRIMLENENIFILVTPEGTRSYAPRWRSGFYHVAKNANVPILLGFLNYQLKHAGIGPVIHPSGNMINDIEIIKNFYRPIPGKFPENGVR